MLIGGLVLAAARPAALAAPAPVRIDTAGGAYNGVEVTLSADRAPAPGEVVTLTVTARPLQDAPNLVVEWELPDGGTLLDGPLTDSLGPVAAGETATLTRQARFEDGGVYGLRARARYFANEATSLAASGVLFFTVDGAAPTASDLDPRTPVYSPPPDRATVDKSALAGPAPRAANGCFNVTGLLSRENRMPVAVVVPETPAPAVPLYAGQYQDQLGSAVPVHHVLVEMREEDTFSDDSYGFTITDANGRFNFSFCDDDGFLNDELELYYRVCAEVREGNNLIASIKNVDEQELYCWDSRVIDSEGGTVDFDLEVFKLNQTQAPVFNIADALYWGWRYWNNNTANSPVMDRSVTAFWQGGAKRNGSFYNRQRTALVIADDPSSTDEWDDSVIIHEWGHFADNQFSCYQNPGGAHSLPGVNNGVAGNRLAFGEGYPDYYQSAARTIMPGSASPSFYVDPDGPTVDLENMRGVTASNLDEGAIAAMMWDFLDTTNDGQDTVSHGQAAIQRVYTDSAFQGNTQCDVNRFLQVWRQLALPTDAATAATIVQNVNITLGSLPVLPPAATVEQAFLPVSSDADAQHASPPVSSDADAGNSAYATEATAPPPLDYRWWDQVSMVVDTSSSMAGPPAVPKINTVKTIIGEQVSDLAPNPAGTEFNIYTFNAGSPVISPLLEGKFFANQVLPPVNGLTATGSDAGCPVPGLGALSQAAAGKFDGDAWLYTDGDSADSLRPEQLRAQLNTQRVRASIVLLGGCGSPARKPSQVSGAEETYLQLAADGSQPSGVVPYLLSSMLTGGQFIYVAPDQLANAVDMVRAQLSHTAGAGRWSDYVSTVYTYRWDRLEPWEYQWFPAESLGQDAGQLSSTPKRLTLPNTFSFYGNNITTVDVSEDGYILMTPCLVNPQFCSFLFDQYLNLLDTDMKWDYIPYPPNDQPQDGGDPAAPAAYGPQVRVYTANFGINEWHIISTQGTAWYGGNDYAPRAYQVWLNFQTGEIRFQYNKVRNEAATAEISLIDGSFSTAGNVVVSKNDFSGATSGMGYKFTPAPPQPSRVYNVEVDALIESVVFLQTGYSGTFAPMTVIDPNGQAVNCSDTANVKCLTVSNKPGDNMVQFVQVDTNGTAGVYKATVSVGSSGSGTFSFNALAASDLQASSPDSHTLPRSAHAFLLDLGRATDDGQLQGRLQTPTGAAFGNPFALYDDGLHGDGAAGDGRFGSDPFTPPARGAAYLWVSGTTGGVAFQRSDPVPFNFQPIRVTASDYQEAFYGDSVAVVFPITNQDSVRHCYALDFTFPEGWTFSTPFINGHCVEAGQTSAPYAYVGRNAPSDTPGEVGEVSVTVTEQDEGAMTGSATARVGLFRRPAALEFDNRQIGPLRPNGSDTAELTLNLLDDLGNIIAYSGPFSGELTATNGSVMSPTGLYDNGRLPLVFTAGTKPGVATISVLAEGGLMAETTFVLAEPEGTELRLAAAPTDLSNATQSALTVTVLDAYGDAAAGESVRLSVGDDDGDRATIGGGEVFEGATNKQGRLTATLMKTAGATGQVIVRAELLRPDGTVRREVSVAIYLSDAPPPAGAQVYLPVQIR
jgi:hypothetical protein